MIAELMRTTLGVAVSGDRAQVTDRGSKLPLVERNYASAAFMRKRLALQREIRELKEAHEQGLALDMAFAARQIAARAKELGTHLRNLLAHRARMDARKETRKAFLVRKARLQAQVQGALYECQALKESIADLFEACLRREASEPSAAWPNGRSPAESYPWLRRSLEGCAVMVDCALTDPGSENG